MSDYCRALKIYEDHGFEIEEDEEGVQYLDIIQDMDDLIVSRESTIKHLQNEVNELQETVKLLANQKVDLTCELKDTRLQYHNEADNHQLTIEHRDKLVKCIREIPTVTLMFRDKTDMDTWIKWRDKWTDILNRKGAGE